LRIVHLSTYDVTGGAALAAYRQHKGLCQLGHDSSMLVAYRGSDDPTVIALAPRRDLTSRLRWRLREKQINLSFSRYVSTRPAGYERFSDDRSIFGDILLRQLPSCDIINLHWIAGFVDYQSFFSAVPRSVPIFWTLHDMNALTGGCHFDDGCNRYETGCGACPQIGSSDSHDLSHQIWQRKQSVFSRLEPERLHIIANNRWMVNMLSRSPLLRKFPVTVVPSGVNTDVFAPRDTRLARDVLGIPQDARVILFVSDSINNRRKGFALLDKALKGLLDINNLFLISLGRGTPQIDTDIPHLNLGHVDNDRLLSLIYSAADLYAIPSQQDNQPNTVLEAMACGTPVVGFDVGGIPEMVRPGITGLLAPVQDVASLCRAIADLLQCSDTRVAMGAACRRIVMKEYRRETQVRRYIELYEGSLRHTSSLSHH
jgi:glycosyltransferase involved in cell wall biosynthesis